MAIALVANAGGASADNTTATTGDITSTGANLAVIEVGFFSSNLLTVQDSKSNSYAPLTAYTGSSVGDFVARVWYALAPIVGAAHNATATSVGTNQYPVIELATFSGVDSYESENGNFDNGVVTSLTTGSVTPTTNGSLIITCVHNRGLGSAQTFAINNGFTILDQFPGGGAYNSTAFAYLIQTSAASVNPTWSWTNLDSSVAAIAVFKPSASAAASRNRLPLLGVS